jgi:uncharacterized protein (DUF169 family)
LIDAVGLDVPPVAVTFLRQAEPSVPPALGQVPAGCKFWEIGSTRSIITGAEDHQFCSVGIYTHNIDGAPESQPDELRETLAAMQGLDYARPEEVASLPVLEAGCRYIQYAPLAESTLRPCVVLLFAKAAQGLVLSEAITRVDGATPPAMGRPACALIPQVRNSGRSATSLGCCGARAYLDSFNDDVALWGLYGEKLELYVNAIEVFANANTVLNRFHERRRADIESGSAPGVKESLDRI